MTKTVAASNPL